MIDKYLYEIIRPIVSKYIDCESDIIEVTKYLVSQKHNDMNWNYSRIRLKLLELSINSSYCDIDKIINETYEAR